MDNNHTFTDEPWKVSQEGSEIVTESGKVICFVSKHRSEYPANARLIAASPNMLEALLASRAVLRSILGTDYESTIIEEQVDIIEDTLNMVCGLASESTALSDEVKGRIRNWAVIAADSLGDAQERINYIVRIIDGGDP